MDIEHQNLSMCHIIWIALFFIFIFLSFIQKPVNWLIMDSEPSKANAPRKVWLIESVWLFPFFNLRYMLLGRLSVVMNFCRWDLHPKLFPRKKKSPFYLKCNCLWPRLILINWYPRSYQWLTFNFCFWWFVYSSGKRSKTILMPLRHKNCYTASMYFHFLLFLHLFLFLFFLVICIDLYFFLFAFSMSYITITTISLLPGIICEGKSQVWKER